VVDERVRQAVRSVVDDQPVLGVLAADLLVDLCGRRSRPRSELDQERVGLRVIRCGGRRALLLRSLLVLLEDGVAHVA
jgi:hypothetical protein